MPGLRGSYWQFGILHANEQQSAGSKPPAAAHDAPLGRHPAASGPASAPPSATEASLVGGGDEEAHEVTLAPMNAAHAAHSNMTMRIRNSPERCRCPHRSSMEHVEACNRIRARST